MNASTGIPQADAADDFARARRQASFRRLLGWLRAGSERPSTPLTFDEMLAALGQHGQRAIGIHSIAIADIRGSVDRGRDFDDQFRPLSDRSRSRWQRVDEALRRGMSLPPIEVYEINGSYFIQDGHHRVSVGRALGQTHIDAVVTQIQTFGTGRQVSNRADLQMRMYERVLHDRLPLTIDVLDRLQVGRPRSFAVMAETIEAWAARTMLAEGVVMRREDVVRRFLDEEFSVAAELIVEAGLVHDDETVADAYLRIACQRYWLCRCHSWDDEVIRSLLETRP